MIEIILDLLGDEVDYALYLILRGELGILVDAYQLDNPPWKNDLADVDVNLLIFEDLDLVYPPFYPYVLEDVYGQVYYVLLFGG